MFGFWKKAAPVEPQKPVEHKPIKFCEDCKWCVRNASIPCVSKCSHPNVQEQNYVYVTRDLQGADMPYCSVARLDNDYKDHCRREARYFEPKPPPPPEKAPEPYRGVLGNIDCTLLRIARTLEEPQRKRK